MEIHYSNAGQILIVFIFVMIGVIDSRSQDKAGMHKIDAEMNLNETLLRLLSLGETQQDLFLRYIEIKEKVLQALIKLDSDKPNMQGKEALRDQFIERMLQNEESINKVLGGVKYELYRELQNDRPKFH